MQSKKTELLRQLQSVIDRHGQDHPDLRTDLEALRDAIEKSQQRSPAQLAADALRVASWVRWIIDHLP